MALKKLNFNKSIAVSVGIHTAVVVLLLAIPHLKLQNANDQIEITLTETSTDLEHLLKPEMSPDPNKIVEFDKAVEDPNVNPNAKYLAAKNNTVKKETIAQLSDQFKNVQNSQAALPKVEKKTVAKKEKTNKKVSSSAKLFDTGFDVYNSLNKKIQHEPKKFESTLSGSAGQASTATDRIKGVDQSLMTQLNTKEYKYYGYYTRIRHQLNQWWQPKVREKVTTLMTAGRKIASEDNKNTKLIIVLNNSGDLVGVQVLSASGIRELDDAAVEAFKKAAPFPNPPKGLVDSDGTIKIRWDFIVES